MKNELKKFTKNAIYNYQNVDEKHATTFCINLDLNEIDGNSGFAEQIDAIANTILLAVHHSHYSGLDNELGTFDTWRGGNIQSGTVAAII